MAVLKHMSDSYIHKYTQLEPFLLSFAALNTFLQLIFHLCNTADFDLEELSCSSREVYLQADTTENSYLDADADLHAISKKLHRSLDPSESSSSFRNATGTYF